jgi:type IV pilus assembly protein PilY1
MKTRTLRHLFAGRFLQRLAHVQIGIVLVIAPLNFAKAEVAQGPLFLGGGNVPGNMVLVPSVEFPTLESVANITDNYSSDVLFEGYFDNRKCYSYNYSSSEKDRHFEPTRPAVGQQCGSAGDWSGNYLNWATTQTIDPFRKVLTGGYRVRDDNNETWLEKARTVRSGAGNFPIRDLNNRNEVRGATPFDNNRIRVRIHQLGSEMRFSLGNNNFNNNPTNYVPGESDTSQNRGFEMSVRVEVCNPGVGVEDNCRQYPNGNWKPEGLIQQNANDIRFSVFSYLNQDGQDRDGGVLRARQKYVGPTKFTPGVGEEENDNREWDPQTGIMVLNPDSADASDTASYIENSGVMNYINKFGQINDEDPKAQDPVSELYYAATRYLKNQGNVDSYTSMSGYNESQKARFRDGFPVIENWEDPIQYECQPNVLLGIGDLNTWQDKNLPGSPYGTAEPSKPQEVQDDDTVNVVTATNRVGTIEGIGNIGTLGSGQTFRIAAHNHSAYMAGLAYDNLNIDMRPDLAGKQTASTHWVDVLENRILRPASENQYLLAAKYGGFKVPQEDQASFDPYSREDPLPDSWWHTNGETLSTGELRPDNYYIAGEAALMVDSLRRAFANISAELSSSAAAVAANSTRFNANTAAFQAAFDSTNWSGDLRAFPITETGALEEESVWSVAEQLDALSDIFMRDSRNILTNDALSVLGATDGELLSTNGKSFSWLDLSQNQRDQLSATREGSLVAATVGQNRLDYLRGDRSNEQADDNTSRPFRQRDSRLGDIVNSNPQFIHKEDFGYGSLNLRNEYAGIDSYNDFRSSTEYQERVPLLVVGANDGMLHGFNADVTSPDGGEELFAYVPSSIMGNLYELTLPDYEHRYYVDGTPRVSDAWLGGTLGWRTLAVGTTGAGGRSVFALDVTDPSSVGEDDVLWEFSHPDLGVTRQQPVIVPLANGEFGVVVTSGYDTADEGGKIWILNAATGRPIETFELDDSGELGQPLVVDLNRDRIVDRIYVGDDQGQLWRLDIEDSTTNQWGQPTSLGGSPLFLTDNNQPITAPLDAAFSVQGELMVFFGTGSFFKVGDNVVKNEPDVQSLYGIVDEGQPLDRSDLLEQEILTRVTQGAQELTAVSAEERTSESGWYIDLIWKESLEGPGAEGERVNVRPILTGGRIVFTTLIPSEDPCAAGGRSRTYDLDLSNGGRLPYSVFDLNNDGLFDENDFIEVEIDGEVVRLSASGFGLLDIGIVSDPAVVSGVGDNKSDQLRIFSGSSGQTFTQRVAGSILQGRKTWEQIK